MPGMPQGAASRSSIMNSSTMNPSEGKLNDEINMRKKDELDEELLKHRYGGTGSRSIHGVMGRLKSPSQSRNNHLLGGSGGGSEADDVDEDRSNVTEHNVNEPQQVPLPQRANQNQSNMKNCIHTFKRQNTLDDDDDNENDEDYHDPANEEIDDHLSTRYKRREFQEKVSRAITVHFGISVAWRNNAFNWINAFSLLGSWITLIHRFLKDLHVKMDDGKFILLLNVTTVVFLWLRFLGFLRGTNIKVITLLYCYSFKQ